MFCVPKKGGNGYRIVQDFRELNQKSLMDKYTMKDIHECIGDIGRSESTIFSTLDLTSGFWQMPFHSESVPKTAFILPGLGQYEWLTSPMGLLGCTASFQRLMEELLHGIDNVIVYIDDLLIRSRSHEHHLSILDIVMTRLSENNMKINVSKCFFCNTEVSYLGFRLTPQGIKPGKDKLKAVEKAKIPATKVDIKWFVGLCNFFRTHIKDFARICEPLNKATRKDSEYTKGPIAGKALEVFDNLKTMLCSESIMAYPRSDRTYALIVDASTGTDRVEGGMVAILCQINKTGKLHAICYASKQFIKHEKNYSPFLLEMDVVVWAMKYYQEHLRGRRFILYMDHKPLKTLGTLHTKTMNRL
jgi:putative transposase